MGQRQVLRSRLQLALTLFCLLASGCRSQQTSARDETIEVRFQRAFEGLDRALEEGEDDSARRILTGIMARGPRGRSLELAMSYSRVLEGRELAAGIEFALVDERTFSDEATSESGVYRLALFCTNRNESEVQVFLPPPTLEYLDHRLYLASTETKLTSSDTRAVENRVVEGLDGLVLAAGESVRIELGEFSLTCESAMARRERWRLKTLSGELLVGERRLPFRAPEVQSCEVVRIPDYFPKQPLDPEVLVEYVKREDLNLPALLERCVRIPASRWTETLEMLAPVVQTMEDQRVSDIAPALRWLSRSARVGGDARTWRAGLASLTDQPEAREALDLPSSQSDPVDPR